MSTLKSTGGVTGSHGDHGVAHVRPVQHACPLASLSLSLSLSVTGDAGGRSRGAAPVPLAPARVTATLHYPVARNRGRVSLNERYDKVCMRRACQMRIKCDAETRCTRYFSVSILPAPNPPVLRLKPSLQKQSQDSPSRGERSPRREARERAGGGVRRAGSGPATF